MLATARLLFPVWKCLLYKEKFLNFYFEIEFWNKFLMWKGPYNLHIVSNTEQQKHYEMDRRQTTPSWQWCFFDRRWIQCSRRIFFYFTYRPALVAANQRIAGVAPAAYWTDAGPAGPNRYGPIQYSAHVGVRGGGGGGGARRADKTVLEHTSTARHGARRRSRLLMTLMMIL